MPCVALTASGPGASATCAARVGDIGGDVPAGWFPGVVNNKLYNWIFLIGFNWYHMKLVLAFYSSWVACKISPSRHVRAWKSNTILVKDHPANMTFHSITPQVSKKNMCFKNEDSSFKWIFNTKVWGSLLLIFYTDRRQATPEEVAAATGHPKQAGRRWPTVFTRCK